MNEKEKKKLLNYKKCLNKNKFNWINRIRFWKYIKEDLDNSIKENYKKQNEIYSLNTSLRVANQEIEQLEHDLKEVAKQNVKKKKKSK